jgi:hypothetical protein
MMYLYRNPFVRAGETDTVKDFEQRYPDIARMAIARLADYYQRYFGVSPENAQKDAKKAIIVLLLNLLSGDE